MCHCPRLSAGVALSADFLSISTRWFEMWLKMKSWGHAGFSLRFYCHIPFWVSLVDTLCVSSRVPCPFSTSGNPSSSPVNPSIGTPRSLACSGAFGLAATRTFKFKKDGASGRPRSARSPWSEHFDPASGAEPNDGLV